MIVPSYPLTVQQKSIVTNMIQMNKVDTNESTHQGSNNNSSTDCIKICDTSIIYATDIAVHLFYCTVYRLLNSSNTWKEKAAKTSIICQRKGGQGYQWIAAGVCLKLEEAKIRKGERFTFYDLLQWREKIDLKCEKEEYIW